MKNVTKSLSALIVACGAFAPAPAFADDWVTVKAAEACNGMRSGDKSPTPEFDRYGVLQADPSDAQRFWCRVEIPDGKYISDANVYGKDTTSSYLVNIELRRSGYDVRNGTLIASWSSTTSQTTWDAPGSLCHQVAKNSYSYWLYLYIPAVSANDLEVWSFDFYVQDAAC